MTLRLRRFRDNFMVTIRECIFSSLTSYVLDSVRRKRAFFVCNKLIYLTIFIKLLTNNLSIFNCKVFTTNCFIFTFIVVRNYTISIYNYFTLVLSNSTSCTKYFHTLIIRIAICFSPLRMLTLRNTWFISLTINSINPKFFSSTFLISLPR